MSPPLLRAEVVTLFPVADATMIEYEPENSMGAVGYFHSGTTQNGPRNRGLIRFDPSAIPSGSKVFSVEFQVSVTRVPDESFPESLFSLRRMLRPWGEGLNLPGQQPGLGSPALLGDATWSHAFYNTNAWSAPGGVEGADFSATQSTGALINDLGRYTFEATGQAASDVQSWLDNPALNFGWMLKCESEETRFTARRFASRESEDPLEMPALLVDYVPPPQISPAVVQSNRITFTFPVSPGITYSVQACTSLSSTNWVTLTNLPTIIFPTNAVISDTLTAPARTYRVRTQF